MLADRRPLEVEHERNSTAPKANERQKRARPLVTQTGIHLFREQHNSSSPERPQKRLCRQRGSGLMLVRVNKVVVGRIVQKDESKAHWEAANGRANPVKTWIRRPREYEHADGDEPTRDHHGDQSGFRWRLAVVLLHESKVMFVDKGRAGCTAKYTDGERNEHKTGRARAISFALLVNDGKSNFVS